MKKCVSPSCGIVNEDDNNFCKGCGRSEFVEVTEGAGLKIGNHASISADDMVGGNKEIISGNKEVVSGNKEEINAQVVHIHQQHGTQRSEAEIMASLIEVQKKMEEKNEAEFRRKKAEIDYEHTIKKSQMEVETIAKEKEMELERMRQETERLRLEALRAATPKAHPPINTVPIPTGADNKSWRKVVIGAVVVVMAVALFFVFNKGSEQKEPVIAQSETPAEVVTGTPATGSGQAASDGKSAVKPVAKKSEAAAPPAVNTDKAIDKAPPKQPDSETGKPVQEKAPEVAAPAVSRTPDDMYREGLSAYKKFQYNQALADFTKAAEAGIVAAQYYLGTMYLEGHGVNKNSSTAFTYINKAATGGYKEAIYQLAKMYDGGVGTEKDKSQARIWYQKAADMGNAAAKRRLDTL